MTIKHHDSRLTGPRHPDLDRLRRLALGRLDDSEARNQYVRVLAQSVYNSADLDELRDLRAKHPGDLILKEWFAKALYRVLFLQREEHEIAESSTLLEELRNLAHANPEDGNIAESLAMALSYVHEYACRNKQQAECNHLLLELRELARVHAENRKIQNWLRATLELEHLE
jgi:hypothetical protein